MLLRSFLVTLLISASVILTTKAKSSIQLSEQAEVIIMTFSPGQEELYSAFGHSAVRVKDKKRKIDIVFNYGIFDFNQPNFYLNFAKGELLYKLGTGPYKSYKAHYSRINRTISEQTLNLDLETKQKMYDYLVNNAKPKNADYYYNYCYNNCATKIRDVINIALGDKVQYDFSYASDSLSYRDLMDKYLGQQPWGDMGIDLCLGVEIDKTAIAPDYMYMPAYLELAIDEAIIKTDSTSIPLVKEKTIVNEAYQKPDAASTLKPLQVFIGVFFIIGILTHRGFKYKINYKLVDIILFGTTGLIGVCLLLLWFGTDHLSQYNYNLIWASPLNLIAVFFFFNKKYAPILRYYLMFNWTLLLLFIIINGLLPQQIHIAFVPIVLSLILRSLYNLYKPQLD